MIWILIAGAYVCSSVAMIVALWRRTPPVEVPMHDFDDARVIWIRAAAKVAARKIA